MDRVLQVTRLHFIHAMPVLALQWLIVGLAFALNLAVWHLTPAGEQDGGFTGGVLALYITLMIGYVQSVTQLLPLAMGMSVSRRSFFLGTVVVALAEAVLYGVALSVLVTVEGATNGWGAGLSFWAPGILDVDNAALQVLVSGTLVLVFALVGIGLGVVSKRWGPSGVWFLSLGSLVLTSALVIVITWLDAWRATGTWLAAQSVTTLAIGLPAVLALAVAAASFAGIRRIVP
jgi:hypothetical protein